MKLKLALLTTGAAGAVAAGGFAYATVGNSSPATSARLPDASSVVQHGPVIPHSAPTCLPDVGKNLPKVPNTGQVPVAGQLPRKLPVCAPKLSANPAHKLPTDRVKPGLAEPPSVVSCSAVPPAIQTQRGIARDFTLPNGMHLAFAHAHSVTVDGHKVCGMIQKFVGAAGQWITVDRISTPPQASLQDMARALKVPGTGQIISMDHTNMWQTPVNNGSMWISDKGYALWVTGSPTTVTEMPAIVSQLRHTA